MARSSRRKSLHHRSHQADAVPADEIPSSPPAQQLERTPSPWIHASVCLLLGVIGAVLYTRTLDYPMQFDDVVYLQNNPLMQDSRSFGFMTEFTDFMNRPTKLGLDPDVAANFATRTVAYATFHLNYVFDGFQPRWYRAVNIGIHIANACLVYALAWLLCARCGSRLFIAATASALFVVHPLATESVTYIVQRLTSIGAMFYLLTLWLYLSSVEMRSRRAIALTRAGATASLLLGMFSNESTVTAPIMAVTLDCLVFRTPLRRSLRRALPLLACLPIIPLLIITISAAQHAGDYRISTAIHLVNSKDVPFHIVDYALTQTTVLLEYLRRLLIPTGLCIDPEWPLYRSALAWPVLLAMGGIVSMLGGAWYWHRQRPLDGRAACALAGIVWFFVTISASSSFVPLPDLMAEHRCYLPSVGIFVVLACLLEMACHLMRRLYASRWIAVGVVALWTTGLGATTWQRNNVWSSTLTMWEDAVVKSPGKFRVWSNLGSTYALMGRHEEALQCCERSLAIEPRVVNPAALKASILNAQNRCQDAYQTMQTLISMNNRAAQSPDVQYNVALSLIGMNNAEQGEKILTTLIEHMPQHWRSHVALGLLKGQRGDVAGALAHWHKANLLAPGNAALVDLIHKAEAGSSVAER